MPILHLVENTSWSYGGLDVVLDERRPHVHAFAVVLGLLFLVVAPMTTAGWFLVRFWPMSGVAWLTAGVVMWSLMLGTAEN